MWTDKPFVLRAVPAVFLAISSPVDSADVVTDGPFWFLDEARARPIAGVTRRVSGWITRQADSLLSIQSGPVRPAGEGARSTRMAMATTTSKDGTRIAFSRAGQGQALIFVDGALCYRASGPSGPVAELLKEHCTVFTYDRRGRGESGNSLPYAVEREVEDIAALLGEAGGSAILFG